MVYEEYRSQRGFRMLLGPQRLQGWANGSENQARAHSIWVIRTISITANDRGPHLGRVQAAGGQTCLAGLSLSMSAALHVREWPAHLLPDLLIQRPDPSAPAFSASFRTSCPYDSTSHIFFLHSSIRLLSAIGAKSVPVL